MEFIVEFSGTTDPAATTAKLLTLEPWRTLLPIPIKPLSSMVQDSSKVFGATKTLFPITVLVFCCFGITLTRSCNKVLFPMEIEPISPLRVELYQTELLSPRETFPTTVAFGAIKSAFYL